MSYSIIFNNATKKYKMYKKNSEKLLDILIPDGFGEDFYALQGISFRANEGDVIGIIGVNGAGKSTLANLITGVIPPTSGEIEVKGQAQLIAISSGLNNNLTGRENIELKCLMLGFSKKEINELMPDIIDFADIGKFIDQPVKSYSSGMKSRLGFAISVNMDPDILVIDEALSVGDQTFADKCLEKMNEFKEKGKTIFFISHSIGQVRKFCQKALWLEAGEVKAYGTIEEVIPQYENFLKEFNALSKEDQKNFKQLVLEKRSRMREQEKEVSDSNLPGEKIPRNHSRTKMKKKSLSGFTKVVITLLLIAVALGSAAYLGQTGLLSKAKMPDFLNASTEVTSQVKEEPNNEKIVEAEKVKPDIRYINISEETLRIKPDLSSQAFGLATFGQSYEIVEKQQDSSGVEWLNIVDHQNNRSWIRNEMMTRLEEKIDDDETANKIDLLIGFYPSLNVAIPMLGKPSGQEEVFKYTEYMYVDEKVQAFTINVSDSTESEVVATLGEPHLRQTDVFMYHGDQYDFIFTVLSTGMINELTVQNREKQ